MGEQPLLQRSTHLEPMPASASTARRFVCEALVEVGESAAAFSAVLAVSELVTNAVVHAATTIELSIEATGTTVTISVSDQHPGLPTPRHWGETATTGRGLRLVAAVSDEFGVDARQPGGKTVWFRLRRGVEATRLDAEWEIEGLLEELAHPASSQVVLTAAPVLLWAAGQQHWEAVLRELYLVRQSGAVDERADRIVDLVAAGRALSVLTCAVERGRTEGASTATVDASFRVTADELTGFGALQDALDSGWLLAVAGRLLIRPALPEIVALRDWACEQVLAQVHGVPPTRWAGTDHPRFIEPMAISQDVPAPSWDVSSVSASSRSVVAADDNNRIVAVSASAAALLGWEVTDLVGRRVVTIVPARLREAHVAGFTRHLTTGETHALGAELELPVLRADGTELACRFLIERAHAEAGRAVYVAWIEPLDA